MSERRPPSSQGGKRISPDDRKRRRRLRILAAAGLVLLLLAALACGGYLYLCTKPEQGVLLQHTYLNGADVSGMTAEEAESLLLEQFQEKYSSSCALVTLAGAEYTVPLWGEQGGILALDPVPAVERAMERGHGAFYTRGYDWLLSRQESYEDEAEPALREDYPLSRILADTGMGEVNTAVETSFAIGEDSISIVKGVDGVRADLDALARQIIAAVEADPEAVTYELDCPTAVTEIQPLDLQGIYDEVYRPVQDATVDPEQDYAVIPSVVGVGFDLEEAESRFQQAEAGSELTIDLVYTQPKVTTEFLKEHLFADPLGSFATNVGGSGGRQQNVRLAAERCNVILMPGEQFSYNKRVGQRTVERGFSEAGAYLNGELVQEVGGGVCQTSSTLYMACVFSNLQIDQRQNHTFPSSYIGLGLDATVSWGGPDFKFTNNTPFPIKITSRYSSGRLSFTIYGTKTEDFSVEVVSEVVSGSGTGHTYHSNANQANDGQRIGYTGLECEVQTYRKVYDAQGNLVSSNKEAFSYYQTHKDD